MHMLIGLNFAFTRTCSTWFCNFHRLNSNVMDSMLTISGIVVYALRRYHERRVETRPIGYGRRHYDHRHDHLQGQRLYGSDILLCHYPVAALIIYLWFQIIAFAEVAERAPAGGGARRQADHHRRHGSGRSRFGRNETRPTRSSYRRLRSEHSLRHSTATPLLPYRRTQRTQCTFLSLFVIYSAKLIVCLLYKASHFFSTQVH